ncbi:hydrolase 2, exosortase A system-associated [Rubrivivax gelatinosus]|uniref:hydrolase 2, exosortase A system-associated n=1 Tax=Rubrivivax gelatinosus TaxID=28068 RepID=UPI0003037422|nr:hydrolase 2, exosortase A system-associated [Rubrivivax gelatinosus]MBG6080398.1 exosortase A-associated hydrolase 2 [Rubrivivax gelatinosus]
MSATFEPRFLRVEAGPLGRRFALHHRPAGPVRGLVVHVHAFAEEMNKSRRMVAMQARALASAGCAVLQLDLLGCGDSDGDFGDAAWARWVEDVQAAARWLQDQHPTSGALPLWLWGMRAGSLLAAEAAAALAAAGQPCHLLLWQPTPQGRLLLQQFLRLKAASELLAGQARAAMEQLRTELAAGQRIEIAGYELSPELCAGMERATLPPPPGPAGRLVWLETSPVETPTLAPAGAATMASWRQAGWTVDAAAVRGPAFWQTTEIEDAPALIEATLAALAAPQPTGTAQAEPAAA